MSQSKLLRENRDLRMEVAKLKSMLADVREHGSQQTDLYKELIRLVLSELRNIQGELNCDFSSCRIDSYARQRIYQLAMMVRDYGHRTSGNLEAISPHKVPSDADIRAMRDEVHRRDMEDRRVDENADTRELPAFEPEWLAKIAHDRASDKKKG